MQTLRAILPGCCAVDAWPLELLPHVLNASSNSPQGSLASGPCWSYIRWKFRFASISSIYLVDGLVGFKAYKPFSFFSFVHCILCNI